MTLKARLMASVAGYPLFLASHGASRDTEAADPTAVVSGVQRVLIGQCRGAAYLFMAKLKAAEKAKQLFALADKLEATAANVA